MNAPDLAVQLGLHLPLGSAQKLDPSIAIANGQRLSIRRERDGTGTDSGASKPVENLSRSCVVDADLINPAHRG